MEGEGVEEVEGGVVEVAVEAVSKGIIPSGNCSTD